MGKDSRGGYKDEICICEGEYGKVARWKQYRMD